MNFPDDMTLGEAREILKGLVDEGHTCPLCTQFAKVYPRKLHSSQARNLIAAYRLYGREWTEWHDLQRQLPIPPGDSDWSKIRYWKLIESGNERREDGGPYGRWRLTGEGVAFVLGQHRVSSHARVYDGRCLGLTGEPISIKDALGEKFNYAELMGGSGQLFDLDNYRPRSEGPSHLEGA